MREYAEKRLEGVVLSYGADRGFGFISAEDGAEYFVRWTEIRMEGFRTLSVGQRVRFEPYRHPTDGMQALEVHVA